MYYLRGVRSNLETLTLTAGPSEKKLTATELRLRLQGVAAALRPKVPRCDAVEVEVVTEGPMFDWLCARFFFEPASASERAKLGYQVDLVKAGLARLATIDPRLSELFYLVTTGIMCCRGRGAFGSGSLSPTLGWMYLEPAPEWSVEDVVEGLVHELTHILLDYDQIRFGHYAVKDHNRHLALTGLLNAPKPFSAVFHSLIVGCEILALRQNALGEPARPRLHPTTEKVRRALAVSYESMNTLPLGALLTPRAQKLFDDARGCLDNCR